MFTHEILQQRVHVSNDRKYEGLCGQRSPQSSGMNEGFDTDDALKYQLVHVLRKGACGHGA